MHAYLRLSGALLISIGVDIGGTFTDVVAIVDAGRLRIAKLPSTRADPSAAVRTVFDRLLPEWDIAPAAVGCFAHGTTVATNAVLARKACRTRAPIEVSSR